MLGRALHEVGEAITVLSEATSRVLRHHRKALPSNKITGVLPASTLLSKLAPRLDRRESPSVGCMLGAAVGDASGALLEFGGSDSITKAMTMPGGGVFGVAPGQATDDSEMGLCLALGLLDSNHGGGSEFDLEAIAGRYRDWIQSTPFDVGTTTVQALEHSNSAAEQRMFAAVMGKGSKANGSLMRCMPLAVWGHRLPSEQLVRCAMLDSSLTHSNLTCQLAVASYVSACAELISSGNTSRATRAANDALGVAEKLLDTFDGGKDAFNVAPASEEVMGWLSDAQAGAVVPYTPNDGFVRVAFSHAFRHLAHDTPFVDALEETLHGFGDTDTNAAIVCGLLGARDGVSAGGVPGGGGNGEGESSAAAAAAAAAASVENVGVPRQMWERVLECHTELGRLRPSWLSLSQIPEAALRLSDVAPEQLSEGCWNSLPAPLRPIHQDELIKLRTTMQATTSYKD